MFVRFRVLETVKHVFIVVGKIGDMIPNVGFVPDSFVVLAKCATREKADEAVTYFYSGRSLIYGEVEYAIDLSGIESEALH